MIAEIQKEILKAHFFDWKCAFAFISLSCLLVKNEKVYHNEIVYVVHYIGGKNDGMQMSAL